MLKIYDDLLARESQPTTNYKKMKYTYGDNISKNASGSGTTHKVIWTRPVKKGGGIFFNLHHEYLFKKQFPSAWASLTTSHCAAPPLASLNHFPQHQLLVSGPPPNTRVTYMPPLAADVDAEIGVRYSRDSMVALKAITYV